MAKIERGITFCVLILVAIHFPSSLKASTEDEVVQLWGVITARQANITLCIQRYPNLRDKLSTIHEQTSYEAAAWVSKIKYYLKRKGYPENDILQEERNANRRTDQRILSDANHWGVKFFRLCKNMPEMHQNKTYLFRPLEMFYPNATNVLGK